MKLLPPARALAPISYSSRKNGFLTGFPAYPLPLKTDFLPFFKSRKRQGQGEQE